MKSLLNVSIFISEQYYVQHNSHTKLDRYLSIVWMPKMKGCTSGLGGQQNLHRVWALREVPSLSVKWYSGLMAVPWVITTRDKWQIHFCNQSCFLWLKKTVTVSGFANRWQNEITWSLEWMYCTESFIKNVNEKKIVSFGSYPREGASWHGRAPCLGAGKRHRCISWPGPPNLADQWLLERSSQWRLFSLEHKQYHGEFNDRLRIVKR